MEDEELLFEKICNLRAGMRGVDVRFILLERRAAPFRTDSGHTLHPWLVADDSASIELTLYDEHGEVFRGGDIVRIINGYCSLHRNILKLYVGTHGQVHRVGEFTMRYVEEPNMSQQASQPSSRPRESLRSGNEEPPG